MNFKNTFCLISIFQLKENNVLLKEVKRKQIYFPIQKLPKICPSMSLSTSYSPVIFPR